MTLNPPARALLAAGGPPPPPSFIRQIYKPQDFVIAADSGAEVLWASQVPIDLLVGDFDSLTKSLTPQLAPVPRLEYPCDKDASDLELALLEAHRRQISEVAIVAALGGRLDHTLFNLISLLEKADKLKLKATIFSPHTTLFQLSKGQESTFPAPVGATLSLLPLDARAKVSLQGVKWPLQEETLQRSSTRGLSNLVLASPIKITAHQGRLLVILSN